MDALKRNETNSTWFEPGHPYTVENREVDPSLLRAHPDNTYRIDEEQLTALCENIAEVGLIQPLYLREVADGGLQILAGHRRCRALCRLARTDEGFRRVPARVAVGMSDADAILILHSSNIVRSMTAEDRLRQTEELKEQVRRLREFHPEWRGVKTSRIIAGMLGMSETTYKQQLRLAKRLVPELHRYYDEQMLPASTAASLAKLDESRQRMVVAYLETAKPRNRAEAKALVEDYQKPVAEYAADFDKAVTAANVAYFRFVDAMRRNRQTTYADKDQLVKMRDKLDEIIRS